MKCKICGRRTSYEKSVGLDSFIVCNACYYALGGKGDKNIKNRAKIMSFILECGTIAEKRRNKNGI